MVRNNTLFLQATGCIIRHSRDSKLAKGVIVFLKGIQIVGVELSPSDQLGLVSPISPLSIDLKPVLSFV